MTNFKIQISRQALVIFLIIALLAINFVFSPGPKQVFAWDNLSGGDHGSTSWAPSNGTYIAGAHTNIDTFTIAVGVTVYIQPYDGASYGWVEIQANNINIQGTLSASGFGYRGGNGGSGGGGNGCTSQSGSSGNGGEGSYGGNGGGGGGTGGCGDECVCSGAGSG